MNVLNFKIKIKSFHNKKSGIYFIHSKKYDISAYGKTKQQAKRMFNVVISEILLYSKP